jgi:hypothetical protein
MSHGNNSTKCNSGIAKHRTVSQIETWLGRDFRWTNPFFHVLEGGWEEAVRDM